MHLINIYHYHLSIGKISKLDMIMHTCNTVSGRMRLENMNTRPVWLHIRPCLKKTNKPPTTN